MIDELSIPESPVSMGVESYREKEAIAGTDQYKHDPLDYKQASIRVVEICPTTSDGLIHCTLRHTNVQSTFTCLSYVWGDTSNRKMIMLNDRPFFVHYNLWGFLRVAQVHCHSTPLWIDAICIDQEAVLERNHQVRQMGEIFSRAVEVIAWLGFEKETVDFLALLGNRSPAATLFHKVSEMHATVSPSTELRRAVEGLQCFSMLEYWQRAWITQEIALARNTFFMAGHHKIHISALPTNDDDWGRSPAGRIAFGTPYPRAERALDRMFTQFGLHQWHYSLVYLLDLYSYKKCHIARDRIFSLLALCAEGSELIPDYCISDEEVLIQTLQCCSRSLCFCTVGAVASIFDMRIPTYDDYYIEVRLHRTWAQEWHSKLHPHRVDRGSGHHRCDVCRVPLPTRWFDEDEVGYTICLTGICEDLRGHFFIDLDNEYTYTLVEAHISLARDRHEVVSNLFMMEIEWYDLSDQEKGAYGLRWKLQDLLHLVTGRGRWWNRRHIGEMQYRGCLSLITRDEIDDSKRLSSLEVRELFKSGEMILYNDFEQRRQRIQGVVDSPPDRDSNFLLNLEELRRAVAQIPTRTAS